MTLQAHRSLALSAFTALVVACAPQGALAQPYATTAPNNYPQSVFAPVLRDDTSSGMRESSRFDRQVVNYATHETPGTIVIDTPNTYLYLVLGNGKALRYGIGVGREGFTWSGVETISRMAEWPDWYPPSQMVARQPYLPRFMAGGPTNPLGARALYLGHSEYRIHGTNAPETIGHQVSSGCIRLTNENITDLFSRVKVGTRVVVLPQGSRRAPVAEETHTPASVAVHATTVSIRSSTTGSAFGLY